MYMHTLHFHHLHLSNHRIFKIKDKLKNFHPFDILMIPQKKKK